MTKQGGSQQSLQQRLDDAKQNGWSYEDVTFIGGYPLKNGEKYLFYVVSRRGFAGPGIIDRLQAGASRLVRIERTDVTGNDRGAIVGRLTQAALRNDVAEARRELNTLSAADRAPAQAWLDKADARDAALAASHQFATEAMTALAKPNQ